MGTDVYGKQPTSRKGKRFHRSEWRWHPLSRLCHDLAPDIVAGCKHWNRNDGDGLDAGAAAELATALQRCMDDGDVERYFQECAYWREGLPDEPCNRCNGVGAVKPSRHDDRIPGKCRECDGNGYTPNYKRNYVLDEDDVKDWILFLQACGGFCIR